jgi:Flp pilus assembly protein TadD
VAAGEFERAASRAREAVLHDPSRIDARVALAESLAGLRRFDEARRELLDAVTRDPSAAGPRILLAHLQSAEGDPQGAEASLLEAIRFAPSSIRARLALGEHYWLADRAADAERLLREAATLGPDHPLANRGYATFLTAAGRGAEAEPYWTAFAVAAPGMTGRFELADYYMWMGRGSDALAVLEPVAARDAGGRAVARLAAVLYDEGEKDRAVRLIADELSVRPSNVGALLLKARMLMEERQMADAVAHARRAVAEAPLSWTAHDLLGTILANGGDAEAAADSFGEAARLNSSLEQRMRAAVAYAAAGDANRAIWTIEGTFEGDVSTAAAAANNVALALMRDGLRGSATDSALALAQYASGQLPERAEPWDTLGTIHLARGETAQAVTALEKSVRLAPDAARYRERLKTAREHGAR